MILLLDNFDSFTYILRDYLLQLGLEIDVVRNDVQMSEIISKNYSAVVLSPGPGRPKDSGNLLKVIEFYHDKVPLLGICLGHQAIGEYFDCTLIKADKPMHGKTSVVEVKSDDFLLNNIDGSFEVVRYHSLILDKVGECLDVTSETEKNEIMSIRHKTLPINGIQFHPEAHLTKQGINILQNWITFNKLVN